MPEVETQERLEELLNEPKKLHDYIQAQVREHIGGIVKEEFTTAMQEHGAVKRLPMSEEALKEKAEASPGATAVGWLGQDKAQGSIRREALALNGKFASFGEFLTAIHPSIMRHSGMDARLKVLGEGQGDQGGFTVPEQFVANLLALALEQAVIRPRAFVMPMAGLTVRVPTIRDTTHAENVFGGVQAYWTPERGTKTASEPTFGQMVLTAFKLVGYTTTSNELLADSAIGLEALLTRLFGEAMAYFEDEAFINGSGAGEPTGILNAAALVSVAKETGQAATTIVAENLDKMYSRMLPSSVSRAVWLAHPDTFPQLAALSRSVGTGGSAVWVMNMAGGPPSTIYGRPLVFTEKCQTVGTVGDIFFTDLSYYVIGDRQGLTMDASPHVRFVNDETVYRFVARLDGKPWLESALTPRYGSNTLSPFVALASRA